MAGRERTSRVTRGNFWCERAEVAGIGTRSVESRKHPSSYAGQFDLPLLRFVFPK